MRRVSLNMSVADGDFGSSDGVVKFDAERAGTARMVEQEQIPAEDEEVNVDLNPNGGEPDKCCLEALQLYQELTGDYSKGNPWIWSKGVEGGTDGDGGGDLDCDEFRGWLEWLVYDQHTDAPVTHPTLSDEDHELSMKKVLEQWESCISEDFSGDFQASGDVFEDAWGITKFDAERAGRARVVQEQMPDVGENIDLGLNIGGNQGECCENLQIAFENIFSGTPYDNGNGFMEGFFESPEAFEGSEGAYHWWDKGCDDEIGPVEVFNELVKPELEQLINDPETDNEFAQMVQNVLSQALEAIQEYEACQLGGFGGVDFGGDFTASGDAFEDAWGIVKNKRPYCPYCEGHLNFAEGEWNRKHCISCNRWVNPFYAP